MVVMRKKKGWFDGTKNELFTVCARLPGSLIVPWPFVKTWFLVLSLGKLMRCSRCAYWSL